MLLSALAVLVALQAPVPAPPPARKSVAILLYVKGAVEFREPGGATRLLTNRDDYLPLRSGDRLKVPEGGRASVKLSDSGACEEIAPGREVTIGPDGCTPRDAVAATKRLRPSVVDQLANVPPAPVGEKGAFIQARGPDAASSALRPIKEEHVATDRPEFSWPSVPGATSYRVECGEKGRRPSLILTTVTNRVPYPAKAAPLRRNGTFLWRVVANDPAATTFRSEFTVATADDLKLRDDLRPLSTSDDPADVALAATLHEQLHAYTEALADLGRLTRLVPDDRAFRDRLAALRSRCGVPTPASPPK